MRRAALCALLLIAAPAGNNARQAQLRFETHEIATGLRGGYQVIAVDMNNDSLPDLVAVASGMSELVWFENPRWERHTVVSGITAPINIAAADLDADGIPELALAHGFATAPDRSAGNLTLLTHGGDARQPWSAREIDRVPTAHRVRWLRATGAAGMPEWWLINSPLVGAELRAPEYRGATPIYFYRPGEWRRELVGDAEQGVVHAVEAVQSASSASPAFHSAGFLGVAEYVFASGRWTRTRILAGDPAPWPQSGASEVAPVRLRGETAFATVEPWHGSKVVLYTREASQWRRTVLDSTLTDAHALVAADLDGDGQDEIIAGERGGMRAVRIFRARTPLEWNRLDLDAGGMAAAGCVAVDLDRDRRIDIACIGTASANLRWYQNRSVQ